MDNPETKCNTGNKTQNEDKQKKTQNTQKTKKLRNTDNTKIKTMNADASED